MIAALYIDPRGPYPAIEGVECWDESRDARLYSGPHPVVAHPPCGPWGRLRHLYRGSEHDCAPRAVEQVRKWGGVLEHPAGSKLWEACDLPPPYDASEPLPEHSPLWRKHNDWPLWKWGKPIDWAYGYTIALDQCEWGHVARKRTWLYLVGVPHEAREVPPYPGREPTHWISGFRTSTGRSPEHYAKNGCAVPPGIKVCSAQQRRRTPREFAEYLVRLARAVKR